MTREQKLDKAINEAYEFIVEGVVDEIEDYVANTSYEFIDFTDETLDFIREELANDDDGRIIYDIMDPATRMILKITRKALIYDNF